MPFAIFEYESLAALITQNMGEITAQLLEKGNDEGMHVLMSTLKLSSKDLVQQSFAKCEAYCLASDVGKSTANSNEAGCESRLRNLVGSKEEHKNLVTAQFATIMGYFYLTLQHEDAEDKWTEKRPKYVRRT